MVSTLQVAGLVDGSCRHLMKNCAENMEIKTGQSSRVHGMKLYCSVAFGEVQCWRILLRLKSRKRRPLKKNRRSYSSTHIDYPKQPIYSQFALVISFCLFI